MIKPMSSYIELGKKYFFQAYTKGYLDCLHALLLHTQYSGLPIDAEYLSDLISQNQEIYEMKINEFDEKIKKFDYQDYLKSPEWKTKSKEAKEKAGWRCQLCNKEGDESSLHTHHRTYERIGNEFQEDLIVLCASCHAKFHNKEK